MNSYFELDSTEPNHSFRTKLFIVQHDHIHQDYVKHSRSHHINNYHKKVFLITADDSSKKEIFKLGQETVNQKMQK